MSPPTRQLHLLRHAKSSWDEPGLDDHERPLARRGERACRRLAERISRDGPHPQLVLCSTATRARQTLELLRAALGDTQVTFEDGLYHASAQALLERIRALDPELDEILLVGHNPGLQDLALLVAAPSAKRARIEEKLPTGALVTLELAGSWGGTAPGSATVTMLVLPRELG